ncbi:MAG: DUF3306 domain-containing protein [Alphaproteobacteria bacterium]|nr:DUF3306 domain-containing protein [Alphaproteobacteria bacterium]
MAEESGFVRRWSQRKAQARDATRRRHGGAQPRLPTAPAAEADMPDDQLARLTDPVISEPLPLAPEAAPHEEKPPVDVDALPDIETLNDTSDYTPFMQEGVPDELRSKALKRLWQLDPLFNEVDGLVEYGEDFSISRKIAKSLYRVGKGMLTDEEHTALDADSPYVAPEDDPETAPEEVSDDTPEIGEPPADSEVEIAPTDDAAKKGKDSQTRPS